MAKGDGVSGMSQQADKWQGQDSNPGLSLSFFYHTHCFRHHCGTGSLILILESVLLFDILRKDRKYALTSGLETFPPL